MSQQQELNSRMMMIKQFVFIFLQAIADTLQSSLRISTSQLIHQNLTVRPEANVESNVPEGLDLYKIIFEVESDGEHRMEETDAASVPINSNTEPVSNVFFNEYLPADPRGFAVCKYSKILII